MAVSSRSSAASADRVARLVTRVWRSVLVAAVIAGLAGFGLSYLATTTYRAHADVLIIPAPGVRTQDAVDDRLLESYALLLGGRRIATAVQQEQTDTAWSVSRIDQAIDAHVIADSSVLRVEASHPQPRTAATLSRAAAQSFVELLATSGIAREPGGSDGDDDSGSSRRPVLVATVIEESPAPTSAASPARLHWAAVGAVVGVLLGLALALTRSFTDRRVRSADDLAEITPAPLLAAIGYDRAADSTPLVSDLAPGHPRFEASRILRTNLQFLDVDSGESVFTITGCLPEEGKSTVASNVAIALARGGESVLLIDGDLRRPRVAEMFDAPAGVGLTTVLVGRAGIDEALQDTDVAGLTVLPSGQQPPNPSELLQTDAMADLVLDLAERFDVVMIDAPPLLPVTDAAVLSTLSAGAVLVVRHGRTTREQVRTAVERLDAVGARLLGTVLTMVPARSGSRYGYGYYGSDDATAPEPAPRPRHEEGRRVKR